MVWVTEMEITIPDDYEVAVGEDLRRHIYNSAGEYVDIVDNNGKPVLR
jgi:hypothetical protein